MKRLSELARGLAQSTCTSRDLLEQYLEKIADASGEGQRVFNVVDTDGARAQADAVDALRRANTVLSPLAGITVSVKDLFDVAGQVTRAGSIALDDAPAAKADSTVVARLRRAGLVIVGRTNMTEFAYSGLGLNPHFGTPLNPYDRINGRIPGGSTSGGAISVTDGMAAGAIGTDTGGSCRIPAAFCGLTGFKPTARRISMEGVLPLSRSLDSVGSIAASVECCALLDSVLADEIPAPPAPRSITRLRLGILRNYVDDDVDAQVGAAYQNTLSRLSNAGVELTEIRFDALDKLIAHNAKGGLVAAEAYAWHRELLATEARRYDPRVRVRILKGADQTAAEYIDLLSTRRTMYGAASAAFDEFDAVIFPTIPITAPLLSDLDDDDAYSKANLLALRNPSIVNFLDRCAISLPMSADGEAPAGLTLMGRTGGDVELLGVAQAVEGVVSQLQSP